MKKIILKVREIYLPTWLKKVRSLISGLDTQIIYEQN